IRRSSRSASNGIEGATLLTTSSMMEAPLDRPRRPMQRSPAARWTADHTLAQRDPTMPCGHGRCLARRARAEQICCAELRTSGPITGIETVEHAQIGRPVSRAATAVVLFVLEQGLLAGFGRNLDQLAAGCFHGQLDFGGLQQMLHQDEAL